MSRPRLLFHCQHSYGLGHLVRSLALADGLAASFDVVLLSGGRMPAGLPIPAGVRVVDLSPLGYDERFGLVSHDPALSVERAQELRRELVPGVFREVRPDVVLVELYPFGRNKFRFELEPLVAAVRATGPERPLLVCSLRDILVGSRRDQGAHDERAVRRANADFDAILVHADPHFARIEESVRTTTPLRVPVHYTGFVTPAPPPAPPGPPLRRVIVSAGGGVVGEPLFRAAADAHHAVAEHLGLTTTIVAGPFLPPPAYAWLRGEADRSASLDVVPQVADLCGEIRRSAMSVSQCGYNTSMDLLRARTPALVVPFAEGNEDEQGRRADRLAALGALRTVPAAHLDGRRLFDEVRRLTGFRPRPAGLDLTGRETSARIVADLVGRLRSTQPAGAAR